MIGYAEVVVGDIEPETPYGEIVTRANNLCGSDYSIWRPIEPYPRTYQAGTLSLDGVEQLPDAVGENFGDSDGDGTPDIIEMVSDPSGNASQLQDYAQDKFSDYLEEAEDDAREMARSSGLFKNTGGGSFEINALGEGGFDSLNEKIDNIVEGLGCGFGGGSCLSLPLNWAPLAPGTAPSILGFPGGPLIPETGIPIFSGLTGIPSSFGCIPSVWPTSPLGLSPSPSCGAPSAGGFLGTRNPTNYFRLYVTPTLTLGVGVAACFGGPAAAVGRIPPPGVSPAVPGGNCVIAARPLFSCEDDGSE
ncbi:MAG TPA: hypothetical protein PK765_01345 [bacterium]|mgnify:CR=1 FL=1|nr:hypothetical protein [bacterium]